MLGSMLVKIQFSKHDSRLGVIHKPRGQNFGYFLPPPPSWSRLLNKAYVLNGHLDNPLNCPRGLCMTPLVLYWRPLCS